MTDVDKHFWVKDICNRLPTELLPKTPSWSALLSAVTQLKTERNNAIAENERLKKRVKELEDALDVWQSQCPVG